MAMNQHAVLIVAAGQQHLMLIAVLIIQQTAGRTATRAHATQLQIVHGLQAHMAAAAGVKISLMRVHSCLINQPVALIQTTAIGINGITAKQNVINLT